MPMSDKLQKLFDGAERCAVDLFMKHGSVGPTYWFIDRMGERNVLPAPPFDKPLMLAFMRTVFQETGTTHMVFFDEAWMLETDRHEDMPKDLSTSTDPRRREILHFNAEEQGGAFICAERLIIRRPGRKPRLGPLKVHEFGYSEGRMVGMLPIPVEVKWS